MPKLTVGSKVTIAVDQLAVGLKDHTFLGEISGAEGLERAQIRVTGEVIDGKLEAVVTKNA